MTGIVLLGLGPGSPNQLTLEAWEILQQADEIYLRTRQHPTLSGLPKGLKVHSFDDYYEEEKDFTRVYERIVERVLELGRRPEGVVYAVPGHPFMAEATSPEIFHLAQAEGIPVKDGRDILIADDSEDFAGAVVKLITDKSLSERIARNCKRLVDANYGLNALETEGRSIIEYLGCY